MSFNPCPKDSPYRNQALRDLADKAPHCMSCFETNQHQVVLSHSDEGCNHKGMGQKADDVGAYLCPRCHDVCAGLVDRELSLQDRQLKWYRAMLKSVVWLLKSGHLTTKRSP